jgi:hypothetical protein
MYNMFRMQLRASEIAGTPPKILTKYLAFVASLSITLHTLFTNLMNVGAKNLLKDMTKVADIEHRFFSRIYIAHVYRAPYLTGGDFERCIVNPSRMQTRPLPKTVHVLFMVSYAILLPLFIFSMVNFGQFSLYVTPIGCFLTTAWHITLVVLSKRKIESHSMAVNSSLASQSGVAAYPPAPQDSETPIIRGRYAEVGGPVYPTYTINVANCTIVFLLALLWAASMWMPLFWVLWGEVEDSPRYKILPVFEGVLGYVESGILFALFGVFVHHRRHRLRNSELSV